MGRSPCCDKVGVKKGPWTPEEDIVLVSHIQQHGPGNWRMVPAHTGLMRCSKSCRLRWTNYLRPGIRRGNFSPQEDKIIVHLQALLGNRWAAIASYLPQRTDNDIKNYWNTHLKKRLRKQQSPTVVTDFNLDSIRTSPFLAAANAATSKGQWESKLQTDMHRAKQALFDALNVDTTKDLQGSSGSHSTTPSPDLMNCMNTSSYYAASIENFSKLLENWKRSSPSNDLKMPSIINSTSATSSCSDSQSSQYSTVPISADSPTEALNSMKNRNLSWTSPISNGDHHQASAHGLESSQEYGEHYQASAHGVQSSQFMENSLDNGLHFSVLEKWLMEETNQDQLYYINQAVSELGCI